MSYTKIELFRSCSFEKNPEQFSQRFLALVTFMILLCANPSAFAKPSHVPGLYSVKVVSNGTVPKALSKMALPQNGTRRKG